MPEEIAMHPVLRSAEESVLLTDPLRDRRSPYLDTIRDFKQQPEFRHVKKEFLRKRLEKIVRDPGELHFFYQTLSELDEALPERNHQTVKEIREIMAIDKKDKHLLQELSDVKILDEFRTDIELEEYFAGLLEYMPLLKKPDSEKQPGTADIEFANGARKIMRGMIKSCETPEQVARFFYGLCLGAMKLGGEEYERIFYDIYAGLTPIYHKDDIQFVMYPASMHSLDDEVVKEFFLVDKIADALEFGYGLDNMRGNYLEAVKKFPNLPTQLKEKYKRKNPKRFMVLEAFYARTKSKQENEGEVTLVQDNFNQKYEFPESAVFKPSRLWHDYMRLVRKTFGVNAEVITIPHDLSMRTPIIEPGDEFDPERLLREQYMYGSGSIIEDRSFISDIISYLKPVYEEDSPQLFSKAEIFKPYSDPNLNVRGIQEMLVRVGNHIVRMFYNMDTDKLMYDSRHEVEFEGEYEHQWKSFLRRETIAFYKKDSREIAHDQTIDSEVVEKRGADWLMRIFAHYEEDGIMLEKLKSDADRFQIDLMTKDGQRTFHNFGTTIKIKKNHFTSANGLNFSYGDHGRINLTIKMGGTDLKLFLDTQYNLHYINGDPVDLPANILHWWRFTVLFHLNRFMFEKDGVKISSEYLGHYDVNDQETAKRYALRSPHRKHLPERHKFSDENSLKVENHPLMQEIVRKIPRLPGESFLTAYNRIHPQIEGETRLWNWVVPPDDLKIAELINSGRLIKRPVVVELEKGLDSAVAND